MDPAVRTLAVRGQSTRRQLLHDAIAIWSKDSQVEEGAAEDADNVLHTGELLVHGIFIFWRFALQLLLARGDTHRKVLTHHVFEVNGMSRHCF